jgi:cytochrome c peroxidase
MQASVSGSPARRAAGAEVALGRKLFADRRISGDGTVACDTCHPAENRFADPRAPSIGVSGQSGTRRAPSLLDLTLYRCYFWDCRADSLEDQVRFPFLNPVELGFQNEEEVLGRIRATGDYARLFHQVYGEGSVLTLAQVARAIVAYERSLQEPASPLDRYIAGDRLALPVPAQAGLALFRGRAGCSTCHSIDDQSAPLTDGLFHDSSVGLREAGGSVSGLTVRLSNLPASERFALLARDRQVAALGRFVVTLDPRDIGKFRTPSLRHAVHAGPYMHDGSVATLEQAIELELYYRGLDRGFPANLSLEERYQLKAFLEAVSAVAVRARSTAGTDKPASPSLPHLARIHHG